MDLDGLVRAETGRAFDHLNVDGAGLPGRGNRDVINELLAQARADCELDGVDRDARVAAKEVARVALDRELVASLLIPRRVAGVAESDADTDLRARRRGDGDRLLDEGRVVH